MSRTIEELKRIKFNYALTMRECDAIDEVIAGEQRAEETSTPLQDMVRNRLTGERIAYHYRCSRCNEILCNKQKYCHECGIKQDWRSDNDE